MDRWGCPLCGEHHELAILSYPWRWSIDSDNVRLRGRVVTLICVALRGTGRQYTKRMLPGHLIWRSPLSSEGLAKLLAENQAGKPGFNNAACAALGCIDPRTARKHISAVLAAVAAKLPILAELLATAPGQSDDKVAVPDQNPFVRLDALWSRFRKVVEGLSGTLVAASLAPLLWLGPGFEHFSIFNRSCVPISGPPL